MVITSALLLQLPLVLLVLLGQARPTRLRLARLLPPPFWRALGTERGGVGGPLLSLAWLAWTLPCKPTLLGRQGPDPHALVCQKLRILANPGMGTCLILAVP